MGIGIALDAFARALQAHFAQRAHDGVTLIGERGAQARARAPDSQRDGVQLKIDPVRMGLHEAQRCNASAGSQSVGGGGIELVRVPCLVQRQQRKHPRPGQQAGARRLVQCQCLAGQQVQLTGQRGRQRGCVCCG